MSDSGTPVFERGPQLRGVLLAASDEAVVQLVAARHARLRLSSDDIRDVKLSAFLIEIDSGHLSGRFHLGDGSFLYDDSSCARVAALGGLSRDRFIAAVSRLLEAGALVVRDGVEGRFVFADRVLRPAGAAEYIDWHSVGVRLEGRSPAFLVLRSVLDAMRAPWDWISLTYELLAEHSCYSLGMVRHGVGQLVAAGVLERRIHAGRGHGYRCTAWALGRGSEAAVVPDVVLQADRPAGSIATGNVVSSTYGAVESGPLKSEAPAVSGDSELTVEIGGLLLRLPVGTEIRMRVEPNGVSSYEVGPHLKFKQQGPS
jgi:hypothetical protein